MTEETPLNSFDVDVRLPGGTTSVKFAINELAHTQEEYDLIRQAFAAGLVLSVDACGFWICNWMDWATSYANIADAAKTFIDEEMRNVTPEPLTRSART